MKNRMISVFTALSLITGMLVPCFSFVNADEGDKVLTHRTAVIQDFDSYNSFDEYILNSNYENSALISASGGKALSLTAGSAGMKYSAEIKITGNTGFPVCALTSDYMAFKLQTPGEKGNTVAICMRLSVWNDLGNQINFPGGTKVEYSKNFSDENEEIGAAYFGDGGWNVNLPAGEEYTYRINVRSAFGANASKLNSVWAMYFEVNPENNYAGDFVLDDFELHTAAGTPVKEDFDEENLDVSSVTDGLREFAAEIKGGSGSNGSNGLVLSGKGNNAFSYIRLNRGMTADLMSGSDKLYWYMDISGLPYDTVDMGLGFSIDGMNPICEEGTFHSGSLTYAESLKDLKNGVSMVVEGGKWAFKMPVGKHWFCLDLNTALDLQYAAGLGKVYNLWVQYNKWNGSIDMSNTPAEFVIDSIQSGNSEAGIGDRENGGFMNESYDDADISLDDLYENTSDGFKATLSNGSGINGSNALKLVGETKNNGASAPQGYLLTNRGFTASLTKDGHNYIYFHLSVSGTNKAFIPMGIVPVINSSIDNGLFGGNLEYAETIEQLENGNAGKSAFQGGGWSVDVPVGSYWYRICLDTAWNDQQRLWAEECAKINFKLNPAWEGDSFSPSGELTFIIDNLYTKCASVPSDIPENGAMNEDYNGDGLAVDDVYQNGDNGFTATITDNGGVENSPALKLAGGTGNNGDFAPMGWLLTNRGAAADLTKDGHNYIYFHLSVSGTKDKTVPMGIVPELNGSTPNGLLKGELEYAESLADLESGKYKKSSFGDGWNVEVPVGSYWFRVCLEKSYTDEQLEWAKSCKRISFKLNPIYDGDRFVPSGNLTFIIDSLYTKYAEIFGSVHKDGEAMNETYDERGLTVDDVYFGEGFETELVSGAGINGSTALRLTGGTGDNGKFAPMGWLYTNRGMKANLVKDGHNYIYFHLNITGTKNKTVPMGIVPELAGSTNNGLFTGTLEYAADLKDFENGRAKKNSFKSGGWSVDVPTGEHWFRICLTKAYTAEQLNRARECTKISFKLNPYWNGNDFVASGKLTFTIDGLHTEYHKVYGTTHMNGQPLNESYDEFGLQAGETAEPSNDNIPMDILSGKGVNGSSALQLKLKKGDSAELLLNRGYTANLLSNGSNYLYFHISSSGAEQKLLQLGLTLDLKGIERIDCTFDGYLEYADTLEDFRDVSSIHRARFLSDGWNIKLPANQSYWVRINLNHMLSDKALPYAANARSLTFKLNMEYQSDERISFLIDSLFTVKDKTPAFDTKPDGPDVDCDDDYRWQVTDGRGEIMLDTVNKHSGRAAINFFGNDPSGELWMRYIFNRNQNMSGLKMRNSFDYSVWVRTGYAEKIKEITVTLAAESGVNDDGTQNWSQFVTWSFSGDELVNGKWTKLSFNYYSPSKSYDSFLQFTRIKGLYVRIIAKNPGDYVEATFDQFEYLDNRKIVESNINAPLSLSVPSFKPQSLDENVISFLNYKTVVAEGVTVKQLKDSVKLDDKYALAVVDKNGKEIADDETVKTGMWLVVKYKKTALSMYYIEIGDPTDTNGTEDVPMSGRPFLNSLSAETEHIDGKTNKTAAVIIILVAACLAAAGSVGFIVFKKKKLKNAPNK